MEESKKEDKGDIEVHFQELASEIVFSSKVPACVSSEFEPIKILVSQSHLSNEFLYSAKDKALFLLELALKVRYEEIVGAKPKKKMNLFRLIEWGDNEHLFEWDVRRVQALREIRNWVAHPRPDHKFKVPGAAIGMIFQIVELINGLYANISKRIA